MRKVTALLLTIMMLVSTMPFFAFAENTLEESSENILKIINDSAAPGKYQVTINDEPMEIVIAGNDEWTMALNQDDKYVVKLLARPDYYTVKKEKHSSEGSTFTFFAEASRKETNDATIRLLNEERFNSLNGVIDDELVIDIIKNRNVIKNINFNNIDSIGNLLSEDFTKKAAPMLKTDNMPLGSMVKLKEVDLGDGFYESLNYDLGTGEHEFLTIDTNYMIQQTKLPESLLGAIITAIKIGVALIPSIFVSNKDKEETYKLLYTVEKNVPENGLITIPISIGGRYTSNEALREGVYELTATNPANGWTLNTNKMFVKVNADGTINQVSVDDGKVTEIANQESVLKTDKAIKISVPNLLTNLIDAEGIGNIVSAIIKVLFDDEEGNMYVAKETGLWVQHKSAEVNFDTGDYGQVAPGSKYLMINRNQLLDLVNSLLDIGKESVNAARGMGYSGLKGIKKIITGTKNGDITSEDIQNIIKTALGNSDKLEGINIPTILEAEANEDGVVTFNKDCDATFGIIAKTTTKAREETKKITTTIERIRQAINSVVLKIRNLFSGIFNGLFGETNNSNISNNANEKSNNIILDNVSEERDSNTINFNDYIEYIKKMGDESLVQEALNFLEWMYNIKDPSLELGKQEGNIAEGENGSASFSIDASSFNPSSYKFEWVSKTHKGLTGSVSGNTVTINATTAAVKGTYEFKISGTYDGLSLSCTGTIDVGVYTPKFISLGKQEGTIIQGKESSASFAITTKGLSNPTYTFEWTGETPAGLTPKLLDETLVINASKTAVVGTYEFRITATDDTGFASATESAKVVLSDMDKIMNIINDFGSNDTGYAVSNMTGLKDGTLPEGNYILFQTSAPEGYEIVKGTYRVGLKWDNKQEKYSVVISESVLAALSQAKIKIRGKIKEASRKLLILEILNIMANA